MLTGGKKFVKPTKSKYGEDDEVLQPQKKKKRDKTTWRMLRKEQKEKYEL